jgi:hypothetical protein
MDTSFPIGLFSTAKHPGLSRLLAAFGDSGYGGAVVPMAGEHYLHHTHAGEIAAEFRGWRGARDR